MKSLWKISVRYILNAIFITGLILGVNIFVFVYISYKSVVDDRKNYFTRDTMERIENQMVKENGNYELTQKGYELIKESSFIWSMRLNKNGDIVWSYQLPKEINRNYNLVDVASFTRWYLKDYPVYVWKSGNELMVYGTDKEEVSRVHLIFNMDFLKKAPNNFVKLFIVNVILIIGLAFLFGYRFYCSLKPIVKGIDYLSRRESMTLSEKGITDELAKKLNQVSELLRKQNEKLEKRDNARTSWIAGVSHDIRTPLALITGYSDELSKEEILNEEVQKKAEIIRQQSLLIRQLIADLNLTSKLEYHAQPLKIIRFLPAVLLRECVADYYNQKLDDKYEIIVNTDKEIEHIRLDGDTGLLLRAFRNLIGNSICHNKEGCRINICLTSESSKVQFFFSDTGVGISENVVHVLEETKEHELSKVHVMGLRIVKQIVTAHGGKLVFVERKDSKNYDVKLQFDKKIEK